MTLTEDQIEIAFKKLEHEFFVETKYIGSTSMASYHLSGADLKKLLTGGEITSPALSNQGVEFQRLMKKQASGNVPVADLIP